MPLALAAAPCFVLLQQAQVVGWHVVCLLTFARTSLGIPGAIVSTVTIVTMLSSDPLRPAGSPPRLLPQGDRAPLRLLTKLSGLVPPMFVSIGDQCLVSGANFLTLVVVGRACGMHELGIYALSFTAVVTLMALQESLLIAPYTVFLTRLRGSARQRAYRAATLLQQLAFGIAASLGLLALRAGASALSPGGEYAATLIALAAATPLWLLREFARRACFAEMDTRGPLLLDGIAASVQLGLLGAMWIYGNLSAASALAAAGAGNAAGVTVWWIAFHPAAGFKFAAFRRAFRHNWAFGRWACVGRLTEMLHAYSLHWLLAFISGPAATGAYAAASSLLALSNPVLMGIGNLLAPETARAYADGGRAALRNVVIRASSQVTLVTAMFVILLATCAEPLLNFTFGGSAEGQVAIVVILSFAMLAGITSFGADNGLRALARPEENFRAALAGLTVAFLVAAVLVGRFDGIGAALGALAGNLTSALVRIESFHRLSRVRNELTSAIAYKAG